MRSEGTDQINPQIAQITPISKIVVIFAILGSRPQRFRVANAGGSLAAISGFGVPASAEQEHEFEDEFVAATPRADRLGADQVGLSLSSPMKSRTERCICPFMYNVSRSGRFCLYFL